MQFSTGRLRAVEKIFKKISPAPTMASGDNLMCLLKYQYQQAHQQEKDKG